MENQVSYNTFYASWHDTMEEAELTDEQYGRVSRALNRYCFTGEQPRLSGMENVIFKMAVPSINASNKSKIKGKEGGKRSGEARKQPEPNPPCGENEPPFVSEPNPPCEKNRSNVNVNVNVNENDDGNGFSESPPYFPNQPDSSTACAVALEETDPSPIESSENRGPALTPNRKTCPSPGETALVPAKGRSPPKKTELTPDQLVLYHAAKACFEASEKAKVLMYQDAQSTRRELAHLKTLAIRCRNIAPDFPVDFLRNVLEQFRAMVNGKYHGNWAFTPQTLLTGWIWTKVIDSLPEAESPELADFKNDIRGLFG